MTTPFYFGSNFKMHQTPAQTAAFIESLRGLQPDEPTIQRFLIPPFTSLATAAHALQGSPIWLGAQNMHWADEGAYTGEIAAPMLRELGVALVMLGHAERRTLFGETDMSLRKKVNAAVKAGLRVLLCVGEQAEQRAVGISQEIVAIQLKSALIDLPAEKLPHLLVAYEPVWSIGEGGTPADPSIVQEMHRWIRSVLLARFGEAAHAIPILYGGSVNLKNCAAYAALPNVNGLFVGRAAWTPQGFVDVMRAGFAADDKKTG
jgi:triosephosphate isomerase